KQKPKIRRNKPKMKNFGNSFRKSRIGDGASDPDSDWTRSKPALDEATHHRADLVGDTEKTTAQARRLLPEAFLDLDRYPKHRIYFYDRQLFDWCFYLRDNCWPSGQCDNESECESSGVRTSAGWGQDLHEASQGSFITPFTLPFEPSSYWYQSVCFQVPGGMKRRVLRWYDYSWSRGRIQGGGDINTALGLLPDKLKTELALHVNLSVLKKVTIFQECQPEFLHDLVLKMKAYIFTPGDSICRKGEVAREMFIIADGILEVLSETGKVLTTMKAGDFFGEIGILNLDGLNKSRRLPASAAKIDFEGAAAAAAGLGTGLPSGSQLLTVAQIKPIMKVSFKQKIQQMQGGGASGSSPGPSTGAIAKKEPPKSLALIAKHASTLPLPPAILAEETASGGVGLGGGVGPGQALAIATISKKVTKPSYKLNTPMQSDTDTDGTPISKPWSKLKLATLMSSSYTSLTNCSPDDLATPLKNYSLSNIPQQMEATAQAQAQSQSLSRPRHHSARSSSRSPRHAHGHGHSHDSTSNTSSSASQASTKRECLRLQKPEQQLPDGELAEPRRKFYQSVFDLSPEYSGLPFVKRLKILNERQKLAELEKALQTRSFSLDCSKSDQGGNLPITESLYRCYSDTSGIYSQFLSAYESTTSSTSISTNTSASASASASASDTGNSRHGQMQYVPLPLSPESNETVERRKLKSILKKLQKGGGPNGGSGGSGNGSGGGIGGGDAQDEATATVTATAHAHASRVLLAEPTLEGPPASAKEEGQFAAFGGASGVAHSQHSQHAIVLSPSNGNGNGTANGNGKNASNGSGSGMGTVAFSSNPMYPFSIPVAVPLPVSETNIWSPTLTLVTPTNSPQESFAFELQPQSQSQPQPQPQPHLQFPPPPVLEGTDSDGIGGLVAGVGSASTSSALGAAASSSLLSLSAAGAAGGAAATAAAASTSYVVECSSSSVSSKSNQILSQNTEFHAQSTTSTDLNLNLQLRQNTTTSTTNNALAGGSQGPRPEGFPEAQDYFNQILSGINHVIKTHMNEMHSKFETQFSSMAGEVRRRDAIIAQLQLKLRSIEQKSSSTALSSAAVPSSVLAIARRQKREKLSQLSVDDDEPAEEENSSSGSSAELLFMRGDSLDTVFTSSPPIQGGRRSISPGPGPSRHHAASANALNCPSSYYSGPGTLSTRHAQSHPSFYTGQGNGRSSSRGYREWSGAAGDGRFSGTDGSGPSGMVVSDVTGNLTRLSDSVILDIGESSSSSSSSSKLNIAEEEDDEDEEEAEAEAEAEADEELTASGTGNNDWEVRMLAAEMERQERKRGHSLSDNLGDLKHCSTFLRRRRKFSDTETEFSETDMDDQLARGSGGPIGSGTSGLAGEAPATGAGPTSSGSGIQSGSQRPRASSLDQFNLRYGIGRGIFKAMSIDRDKDKL
ncbi:GL14740, partial [Drosophila persimilis]